MDKKYNNFILLVLTTIFFFMFRFNASIKECIVAAITSWLYNLVPFLFPLYIIIDLMQNYGFTNRIYRLFKSNIPVIVILSMLLGCPSNAKFIKEFYDEGYISLGSANYLLTFAYSPNPLFVLGISNSSIAFKTLAFIYITNLLMAIVFRHLKEKNENINKIVIQKPFVNVLETSIYRAFKILVLILGIIIVYAIINMIIDLFVPSPLFFVKSILEITNACMAMKKYGDYSFFIFACSFGGLSIHTQIKSILEDTPISYNYFLFGRIIASVIALIFFLIF